MTRIDASDADLEQRLPPWTRELLDCLTPQRRRAFVLREAGGLKFEEIGERLDVSTWRAATLHREAVRVITAAARRGVLFEQRVPTIVPHAPPSIAHKRCTVPEEMEAALELSVDELNLGVRTMNVLDNWCIRTIGDLVSKTEGDLLRMKNLGRKSLREITEALAVLGLHLAMTTKDGGAPPT